MLCPNCSNVIKSDIEICPSCGSRTREEVVQNWSEDIAQVVLGYDGYRGLVHGLQKDAIQNGWGHRLSEKGKNWCFEFHLFKGFDDKYILKMTDIGGYGLTGRNLKREEIPDDLPEDERLARFEHMRFSGGNTQAAGLFGRGKLLFMAASKDNHIIYDSLTKDGIYRLNERKLKGRRLDNFAKAFEGDNAKQMLKELTKDTIKPLLASGTRIIIINPRDEIVSSILDNQFIDYIGETWWQIPLKFVKHGAKIIVKSENGTRTVKIPKEFEDMFVDKSDKYKIKKYPNFSFEYNGVNLKIKKVYFIVAPKEISPEMRGLYLYRREMKVANLELRSIPEDIEDKFFGFVELEKNSDIEKIYLEEKCEGPEHYSVTKNRGLIRKLRSELQLRFDEYKSDLGYRVSSPKLAEEKTKKALANSLNELNKRMADLGVSVGGTSKAKDISIRLEDIRFPGENNIVDIGDNIEKIKFKLINKFTRDQNININVFTKKAYGETIETIFDEALIMQKEERKIIGPFSFKIVSEKYQRNSQIHICCFAKDQTTEKILGKKLIPIFIGITPPDTDEAHIEMAIDSINFPHEKKKRVNYGESITNVSYIVTNKTAENIEFKFKARIVDAKETSDEIALVLDENFSLEPFATKEIKCPDIPVTQERYNVLDREKGPVLLKGSIIALKPSMKLERALAQLESKTRKKANPLHRKELAQSINAFDSGDKLAKYDVRFWINMDGGKGIFEECIEWRGGEDAPRSRIQMEDRASVCLINTTHPVYESLLREGKDQEDLDSYVYEQLVRQTLTLLLRKDMLENWPEITGKSYRENIKDEDSEDYEKIEAFSGTMDYLYGQFLK